MVNIVNEENGEVHRADIDDNIGQAIINLIGPTSADQHAIVFMGKKLQTSSKFSDVEFLNDFHTVRIVKQRTKYQAQTPVKKHTDELINCCTIMLKKIKENHDLSDHIKLMTYVNAKLNDVIKQFPAFAKQYNSRCFDLVFDFRLLMQLLAERDPFLYDCPQVLNVFKMALEYALAKEVSDQFSNKNFIQPSTSSPLFPVITAQMLASALASTGAGASGMSNLSTQNVSLAAVDRSQNLLNDGNELTLEHLRQKYSSQLIQMREFGFNDDLENVEALRLSEGNVEMALQIVIDSHEERMDST